MWPFTQSQPDELEALRTRVEALERDNHERQLAILTPMRPPEELS